MSPELALVDAALAARLRAVLDAPVRHVAASASARSDHIEPADDAVDSSAVAAMARVDEDDPLADLIVHGKEAGLASVSTVVALEGPSADPFVPTTAQSAGTSRYPALPSPANGRLGELDATETALRDIRNRLAAPTSETRRRLFRRRFTVASGVSAAVALGLLATSVGFGVT